MKTIITLKSVIAILGLIFILSNESAIAQTKPFDLRFTAMGPFPITYDSYIDDFPNANITIRNKTSQSYEFEMYSSIVGPYGISGESRIPHCTKSIGPNSSLNFPRGSFIDLCINYRIADFTFDQLPGDLQARLLQNHILPEGEYEICLKAKELGTSDIVYGSVCFKFNIVHPARPIILQPTENALIDATVVPTMILSWTHAINNPGIRANTTYNVKVIDLGLDADYAEDPNSVSPTYSPYELIDDPGVIPVLFIENVKLLSYLITLSDLNFIHGHKYAVCVYAANDQQPLGFDLVRSDLKVFQYSSEVELECGQNISFDAISPAQGAYIPFTQVPLVMKYAPYCDKYLKFWAFTNLTDETTDQIIINNFERSPGWNFNIISNQPNIVHMFNVLNSLITAVNPFTAEGIIPHIIEIQNQMFRLYRANGRWKNGGPRRYLNYIINDGMVSGWDADAFYSSHLALNDLKSMPTLLRGHRYTWSSTDIKMVYFNKPVISASMTPVEFTVGMQAPLLNAPIGGASVDTGIVDFNLKFNNVSESILPPFKIFQIENKEIIEYAPRKVNEYGVIQVSKSESFNDNLMAKGIHLQFNEDDFYENNGTKTRRLDAAKLSSELYKDLNFEGRFTDTATYYWRLGWYNNPDAIPAEVSLLSLGNSDFYNITTVDSFKIGNGIVSPPPVTIVEVPRDTVCGSSCTVELTLNTNLITSLAAGDEIHIGKFIATLTEVSKTGTTYSGKARIKIPFLHNVTIKTTFSNLSVNTNKIVFNGEMNAESGGTELESIANIVLDQPMQLPLGWDATVKGRHTILSLTQMKFLSTRADMTATINFGDLLPEHMTLPEQAEMSGTFCFHPGGFSETMVFHLSEDMPFDDNNSGYGFVLKGGAATDTATMCYIKWACKGFEGFQLAGEVLLSESLLNKDSGLEANDAPITERVKAGFRFKYIHDESKVESDNGFILQANMDAFQFKDFEGWGFDSDTIFIDWSDSENPPGFVVPPGYTYAGMNDPQLKNGWEGIYIPKLKTLTPKDFGSGVNTRTVFSGSSMIFGEGKYHVSLKATNIFNNSWARMRAKMDTIQGVISSDEKMIRFKGGLLLPFTDTSSWIAFGGHYSGFDSIHLYVAIAGDSVHMADLPIEFKFDNTSLLNIVRGADRTFRANAWFNGVMDLEMNAGHVHSSLSSLSYSGIKFENLGYQSGQGFDRGDFSFASPQKTMNGFPIQLDSIDFVSEGGYQGFYFKPKVVLVGDVNGFSAAAGLNLLFKFNTGGSYDFIDDTKLELKDVELDVKVSGFELKGRLAFINRDEDKGMEGILAAKLPGGIAAHLKAKFGTKTTNENAAFNTAANFSYWYVDGMVTFGNTGIPMFAGMSLYGIGGGMWYHMNQSPITSTSYAGLVGTATDTANLNYSTLTYQPSFSSHYGMKLQGLFGSENEGKTYNMLLAVWAQFNTNGGPNVGLDGDLRFMGESVAKLANGDAETTKKSVWGDVHFVYNGQQHFVQGNLNAYVNVTVGDNKIFYGKLPRDKMVEAEFYAAMAGNTESDTWYLKIGTPEAKAGARFDLKIKKVDISAYLMVGHGLPNALPEPDPGFMAMLNTSDDNYLGSSGTERSGILNMATGIGAGVLIKDTFSFHYQPFYLDVNAIIGADINITHNPERKCAETGLAPGVDGWYGTGQLYAGIDGSFGIEVDIWFIEGRFEFLRGSIALLMRGGLPNPSWFYAKGAFKYRVAGLIEGTHAMELNMGDKCTPVGAGNLLTGMTIIQDLYPADNAQDVSVYVTPKALISPYVNHEIEIFDVDLNKERIFRVEWKSNKLKKGETTIASNLNLTDGSEVYMAPKAVLDDLSWYTIEIKVTGSEKKGTVWTAIPGYEESKKHRFRTGVMPDEINEDCLATTYPIIGQNYFLKDEVPGSPGYVTLRLTVDRLLYSSKVSPSGRSYNYHYEARFYKVGDSAIQLKRTITIENFMFLKYQVSALANNTTYRCKIVRVLDPSMVAVAVNPEISAALATELNNTLATTSANATLTNVKQEGFKSTADVQFAKTGELAYSYKLLPQKFMKFNGAEADVIPTEHILFEYKFKTSLFNKLTQKIGGKTWSAHKLSFAGIDIFDATAQITEPFDKIDLQGYTTVVPNQESKTYPPLVQFGSNLIYSQGENYGDINKFDFLSYDALANRHKNSELYKLPKDLIDFIDPPGAPSISLGLSAAWNYQTLQYRFSDLTIQGFPGMLLFEPPHGKAPINQEEPTLKDVVLTSGFSGIAGVSSSGSGNVSSTSSSSAATTSTYYTTTTPSNNTSTAPPKTSPTTTPSTTTTAGKGNITPVVTDGSPFEIRLHHGVQMYRQNRFNQDVLSSKGTPDVMAWLKTKSISIERRLSEYILRNPSGYIECIDVMPMGIIYYAPLIQVGSYNITSKITANVRLTCPPPPPID